MKHAERTTPRTACAGRTDAGHDQRTRGTHREPKARQAAFGREGLFLPGVAARLRAQELDGLCRVLAGAAKAGHRHEAIESGEPNGAATLELGDGVDLELAVEWAFEKP